MSAPTLTPIGKFRECMDKLLARLETWATEEQQRALAKFQGKYKLAMRANPRDTIGLFIDGMAPYAEYILEGDDEFFLGDTVQIDEEYAALGNQLKIWWPGLGEDQKDYVKKQFKLLLMLGAIAVHHEPLRQVINRYRDPSNPLVY